jgi:hypothetical protein
MRRLRPPNRLDESSGISASAGIVGAATMPMVHSAAARRKRRHRCTPDRCWLADVERLGDGPLRPPPPAPASCSQWDKTRSDRPNGPRRRPRLPVTQLGHDDSRNLFDHGIYFDSWRKPAFRQRFRQRISSTRVSACCIAKNRRDRPHKRV